MAHAVTDPRDAQTAERRRLYPVKHVCAPPREAAPLYDHRVDYYWSKARSQRVYSRISLVKVPARGTEVFYPRSPGD